MGVVHYVGRIVTSEGCARRAGGKLESCRAHPPDRVFDVLESGTPGVLLFQPVQGFDLLGLGGWALTSEWWIPVKRSDLKRDVARLLPRRR